MATSGSSDLVATRDDIITEALEAISVLAEGESPNAAQLTSCGRTLNYMVKAWQGKDVGLWAVQPFYVFLASDTSKYTLGDSNWHATNSYVKTQLNGEASSGAGSVLVDSTTGISDGDYVSVGLSDGTRFWTTVNGAPTSTTITLTDVLTGAASDNAYVFAYTTKENYPYDVLHAVVRDTSDTDLPIELWSRDMYNRQTDKTSDGRVVGVYYDKKTDHGDLYVWPQSDTVDDVLILWAKRILEDFDADNDAYFPQEWFMALSYHLAWKLGPKYGIDSERHNMIKEIAAEAMFDAMSQDTEKMMQFSPNTRWGK